jgi:hypothetical protein
MRYLTAEIAESKTRQELARMYNELLHSYRLLFNNLETKTIDEGFKVGDKVFLIYSDSFTKPEIQKGKIVDKRYLIEFNDGSDEILEHNELYKTRQEAEQALKESREVEQTRQQESRGGDDE